VKKRPIKLELLPPPKIEIINLIDVMITLIAFFLLTTVFAQDQQQLGIKLPTARQSRILQATDRKVRLQLDRQHRLYLDQRRIREADLAPLLKRRPADTAVLIQADQSCSYGAIVRLVDLVKKSGLTKVGFGVKNRR
jgi:biopolymer transport protein ExbD